MQEPKKIGAIIALSFVIAASVVWIIKFQFGGAPRRNPQMEKEGIAKVDEETLEVITLTRKEWRDFRPPQPALNGEGSDIGSSFRVPHWKNPNTGEYTMVPAITCRSCGAQLPGTMFPMGFGECPKCGKSITAPPEDGL